MARDGKYDVKNLGGQAASPGAVIMWDGARAKWVQLVYDSVTAAGPPTDSPFWWVTDETC